MCVRPGISGVSENVHMRSIIGRFLERSRVCYFHDGGSPEIFGASADWIERDFFRRMECLSRSRAKRIVIHGRGY